MYRFYLLCSFLRNKKHKYKNINTINNSLTNILNGNTFVGGASYASSVRTVDNIFLSSRTTPTDWTTAFSGMGYNSNYRGYISVNRSSSSVDYLYTWSPTLAFGIDDVFGFLHLKYNERTVVVGAGSSHNTLHWTAELAFADHNHDGTYATYNHSHNYLPLSGGTLTGYLTCNYKIQANGSVQTSTKNSYSNGAMEIREAGLVGSGQTANSYAPKIGFHWGGIVGSALAMHTNGKFYRHLNNGDIFTIMDSSHFVLNGTTLTITT